MTCIRMSNLNSAYNLNCTAPLNLETPVSGQGFSLVLSMFYLGEDQAGMAHVVLKDFYLNGAIVL